LGGADTAGREPGRVTRKKWLYGMEDVQECA